MVAGRFRRHSHPIRFDPISFLPSLSSFLSIQSNPIPPLKLSLWLFCCFSIARRASSPFSSGFLFGCFWIWLNSIGRFIAPRRRRCHLRPVLTRDMFSSHLFFSIYG
ncbi:unnamed protein product [Musa acuminata var. zebrina]